MTSVNRYIIVCFFKKVNVAKNVFLVFEKLQIGKMCGLL